MFKVNTNTEAQLVKLKVRESQAHYACIQEEPDKNPWYHDILRYVKDQQYPDLANDNEKITLRCVDASEAKKIVHEIHEGVCGTHASGHVMAR